MSRGPFACINRGFEEPLACILLVDILLGKFGLCQGLDDKLVTRD